jgi:hypothetical protein
VGFSQHFQRLSYREIPEIQALDKRQLIPQPILTGRLRLIDDLYNKGRTLNSEDGPLAAAAETNA